MNAADSILDGIARKCQTLAEFPHMGRSRTELGPSLRSLPAGRYVIFYRPVEDGVEVIRVLNGARDIDALFLP